MKRDLSKDYDTQVPLQLKREQVWFGSIIERPIDEHDCMCSLSPSGRPMEEEALKHIMPGPMLTSAQRMQIYNQQYWWRLLKNLQDSFPLLLRLFGNYQFNQLIAFPYLVKYPPSHWSLNVLGDRLLVWLTEDYQGDNKRLAYDSASIDWAFTHCFIAGNLPSLSAEHISSPEAAEEIPSKMLYTQPHLHLLNFKSHLFKFREECVKQDPDHYLNHSLPKLESDKDHYFVVYRNLKNEISWKEISSAEYHLLDLFKQGTSIEIACEWLERQDPAIYEMAMQHLQQWFQEWSMRGWLSLEKSS